MSVARGKTPKSSSRCTVDYGRACDACANRKVRCNRETPCRRCKTLSIPCTIAREANKPGPKGPWALKRRASRQAARRKEDIPQSSPGSPNSSADDRFPISFILDTLTSYHEKLYSLWPVVERDVIVGRLQNPNDLEAYALAAALCAVTIAQLNLQPSTQDQQIFDSQSLAAESERARAQLLYQEQPSVYVLLSSFFLHISCANHGQVCKATLLLREAITFAQLLGLDDQAQQQSSTITTADAQLHIRILWLFFITERGHTTRFGLARILPPIPVLPQVDPDDDKLLPFVSLCRLFHTFGQAMDSLQHNRTPAFFAQSDTALQRVRQPRPSVDGILGADFLITQQWMRIVLWKSAIFGVPLTPASGSNGGPSIAFPACIARNVMMYLSKFPRENVEAHGLGMEMKLTEVAISLANVLLCVPAPFLHGRSVSVGPGEVLAHLERFLTSFRGGSNPRLKDLHEKMAESHSVFNPISRPFQLMPNISEIEELLPDEIEGEQEYN